MRVLILVDPVGLGIIILIDTIELVGSGILIDMVELIGWWTVTDD